MAAVLSVTAAHRRLTLHFALTVFTHRRHWWASLIITVVLPVVTHHWRLSHAHSHSHTAVSDGIGGVIDGYGFFIAAGAHFIGLTVFQLRTAVKHGIVALCEIACREEFFSGLITDFYRVSGTAVSA